MASMSLPVSRIRKTIHANETASRKVAAARKCAMSLVRQLFHLGVIKAANSDGAPKKKNRAVPPFDVDIPDDVIKSIDVALESNEITPVDIDDDTVRASPDVEFDLLPLKPKTEVKDVTEDVAAPAFAFDKWSPPEAGYNVWTGQPLADYSSISLDETSAHLSQLEEAKYEGDAGEVQQAIDEGRSSLPIAQYQPQLLELITDHSVSLIRGQTGSGKTTQVAQYILDSFIADGRGAECNIIVTQPRRISAISVAERVASERGETLSSTVEQQQRMSPMKLGSVGYSVRFESRLPRPFGSVLFCTIGILLRRMEGVGLRGISHIIVDEIHERDKDTDFLLILLRDMVMACPNVRIILMSATINTDLFQRYFGTCPLLEVAGRCFEVQRFFIEDAIEMSNFSAQMARPPPKNAKRNRQNTDLEDDDEIGCEDIEGADGDEDDDINSTNKLTWEQQIDVIENSGQYSINTIKTMRSLSERYICIELIVHLCSYICESSTLASIDGAILIFLPGWSHISLTMRLLTAHSRFGDSDKFRLLALHSQVPRSKQHLVFEKPPDGVRKIIMSTNIAESSVTIDDVVFVIDAARSKLKIHTSHNSLTEFVTTWASRTNLEQRKGRAGRVQSGYCFHLLTKQQFDQLDEHIQPEILRSPLYDLVLSIKSLQLGSSAPFLAKAMESPPLDAVIEAEAVLRSMMALTDDGELTSLGHLLAALPLDPTSGKMLALAACVGLGETMASIAAAVSFALPFELVPGGRLTGWHRSCAGESFSDHVLLYNCYRRWLRIYNRQNQQLEESYCRDKLLMMNVMRMIHEAKKQIMEILVKRGFPYVDQSIDDVALSSGSDRISNERKWTSSEAMSESDVRIKTVSTCLIAGLYPNVCYSLKSRRVLTVESAEALLSKNSIICPHGRGQTLKTPSPFFIFQEKVRTKVVACRTMTMINPLQLLLLANARSIKASYITKGVKQGGCFAVTIDGWLRLGMSPHLAAKIVALRRAIDRLLLEVLAEPSQCFVSSTSDADSNQSAMPYYFVDVVKAIDFISELNPSHFRPQPDDDDELLPPTPYTPTAMPQIPSMRPPLMKGPPHAYRGGGVRGGWEENGRGRGIKRPMPMNSSSGGGGGDRFFSPPPARRPRFPTAAAATRPPYRYSAPPSYEQRYATPEYDNSDYGGDWGQQEGSYWQSNNNRGHRGGRPPLLPRFSTATGPIRGERPRPAVPRFPRMASPSYPSNYPTAPTAHQHLQQQQQYHQEQYHQPASNYSRSSSSWADETDETEFV